MEKHGSINISLHSVNKEFIEKFIEYHRNLGDRPLPELKYTKNIHLYKNGKLKLVKKEVCYHMTSNEYADLLVLEMLYQKQESKIFWNAKNFKSNSSSKIKNYTTIEEIKIHNPDLYEYYLRARLKTGINFKQFINELKNK